MAIATIEWRNKLVRIIDQTKLPLKLKYTECRNVKSVCEAIKELRVRGAPALAIAGALGVALGADKIQTKDLTVFNKKLDKVIGKLASSRPTAVNLFWALERMRSVACRSRLDTVAAVKKKLLREALKILDEDRAVCRKMAGYGSSFIRNGDSCLTICNAGALATADYGTALGVFYRAKKKRKNFKVFSLETRPLLQGARLTSWELMRNNIDVTVIGDSTAGYLISTGKIDKVFVGADRIAANGDTANKIGTFNLALVCRQHNVPFYVVAPGSTFDLKLTSGADIPIEHRRSSEVSSLHALKIAPKGVRVYNPAFDVTAHDLVSAFITEKGVIRPPFRMNIKNALC